MRVANDNDWLRRISSAAGWYVLQYELEPNIKCTVCTIDEEKGRAGSVVNIKPVEAFTVLTAEGKDKEGAQRTIATAYERLRPGHEERREWASQILFEAVQSIFE